MWLIPPSRQHRADEHHHPDDDLSNGELSPPADRAVRPVLAEKRVGTPDQGDQPDDDQHRSYHPDDPLAVTDRPGVALRCGGKRRDWIPHRT